MSGSLIDANVLLDIATADATWMTWSQEQVRAAAGRGAIYINPIIYTELAPAFATKEELDRWLDPNLFQVFIRRTFCASSWTVSMRSSCSCCGVGSFRDWRPAPAAASQEPVRSSGSAS